MSSVKSIASDREHLATIRNILQFFRLTTILYFLARSLRLSHRVLVCPCGAGFLLANRHAEQLFGKSAA
jgi:hypothetical protein